METFSASLAICAGNSPVPAEFPTQRPVTRSFDVFFDLRPNKQLSKEWWGWWFGTQSCPLWRHNNAKVNFWIIRFCVVSLLVWPSERFVQRLEQYPLEKFAPYKSPFIIYNVLVIVSNKNVRTVMTSWHGNAFFISSALRGESTGHR